MLIQLTKTTVDQPKDKNKCAGLDTAIFFPVGHRSRRPSGYVGPWTIQEEEEAAISICKGLEDDSPCENLEACGHNAITRGERYGVWGGMGMAELRRKISRAQTVTTVEISRTV